MTDYKGNNTKCKKCKNFENNFGFIECKKLIQCKQKKVHGDRKGFIYIYHEPSDLPKIKINKSTGVGMSEIQEEGTKFDKGKPHLGEMIMDFRKPLLEICKVWEFGADKYSKSNWKKVGNGEDRYTNALARHFAAEMDEGIDAETKLHHAIHVAWNAIARLYFIIKDGE